MMVGRLAGGIILVRASRWMISLVVVVGSFAAGLMLAYLAGPHVFSQLAESDRWVLAVGFATVAAGLATGWGVWWSTRDMAVDADSSGTGSRFSVRAATVSGLQQSESGGTQNVTFGG